MGGKKGSSIKLTVTPLSVPIPSSSSISKAQDMENILFHRLREMVTISSDDSMPSTQTLSTAPIDVPNREESNVLLECFPTFTNMEPATFHMNKLFPMLERIPVDVTADPQ